MKKFLCFLSVILTVLSTSLLFGCSMFSTDDEIEYKETDDGYMLYRYEGNSSHAELEIPDEYEGKPVTEIGKYAVSAAEYLTVIKIGKNVTRISERAFCGTYKNLKAFVVDPENTAYCSIDGIIFTKDLKSIVAYPDKREGVEYVVPDGVETIADCAFYMCESLKKVTLATSVVSVGEYAFFKCVGLESVTLNEGLKTVGKNGFSFTEGLLELHLPSTIEKIGDYGFYSKTSVISSFTTKKRVEQIECGKGWRPQTTGMENSALTPVYVGE